MRILLVLLIFPFSVFSQTAIEQIRNDSDVVNYIRVVGHEFFPYTKGSPLRDVTFNMHGRSWIYREKLTEEDGKFTDSVMIKRWFLADFDNDQHKDLVYYGRIDNDGGIFVFFGGSMRKMTILTDGFARWYPHSIESYKIGNTNSIIVGTLEQPEWGASKQKPFAERFFHDTLVYKFGGFTEYNGNVKRGPAFDSIHYRPLSNWVGNNNRFLRIYSNGSATYVRSRDTTGKDGSYETITEKMVANTNPQEWQDLLDYIKFSQLKDSFELKNVSDQTVGLTTVYFANGSKKTVWDYGMTGTYGLETLYARIRFWIDTMKWKVVAQRPGYLGYKGEF
jgi:hypothetical protein